MMKFIPPLIGMISTVSLLPAEEVPAKLLDLSSWKLTIPVKWESRKDAKEIKQPDLASYTDPNHFFTPADTKAVIFRAHCGGSTTKGSKYPRCELREMSAQGKTKASWETNGKLAHTMTMRAAITHTPVIKKHVVCAQIHDSTDDLIMIRLEGTHLFVERKPFKDVTINRNYVLGTVFDLKIQAHQGHVKVWYDGQEKMNWEISRKGCYFKAGCYTQSNTSKGDMPDSYGEVALYKLQITHGNPQLANKSDPEKQ